MKINIAQNLKSLRKVKGINQEALAEHIGISVQAVSRWECENSYPDIEFLPPLAEFFGVSIDYLLTGADKVSECEPVAPFPDDGVLRVVQYRGSKLLDSQVYTQDVKIPLAVDGTIPLGKVEIWGNADISGDISGDVNVGSVINCKNIGGSVKAYNANCGNVGGGVMAESDVNCGNVGGGVTTTNDVNCGNVGGGISTEGSITCGDIGGGVTTTDDVNCGNIGGGVSTNGNIICGDIEGNVECGGELRCKEIKGDVTCKEIIYIKADNDRA